MGIEILVTVLGGIISLLAGAVLPLISKILKPYLEKEKLANPDSKFANLLSKLLSVELNDSVPSYRDRITRTLDSLKKASEEMETATFEFNSIMKEKQSTIDELESKLTGLSTKETELTSKIETLQKVPLEALTHFENILNKGDKRSAYRDYILFGTGVVVSVIVTIVLKKIGY